MIADFRLKVFKTVADRLSFTRAAEELYISQPAVTKHINELERQLGVPLFLRQGNAIVLTAAGQRTLRHVNRILTAYNALEEEFAEYGTLAGKEIRLGASTTLSQYVLPAILARFQHAFPKVRPTLFNGNTEQIEQLLAQDQLDLGLIEGNASDRKLHYELFRNDRLVLVTAAHHDVSAPLPIETLKSLPLVIRESGSGTLAVLEKALRACGLTLRQMNIQLQLGSTESIKRYLYHTDTYAFLSVQAISEELADGKLHVVETALPPIDRSFRFVTKHGVHSRLVETFKQFCLGNQD